MGTEEEKEAKIILEEIVSDLNSIKEITQDKKFKKFHKMIWKKTKDFEGYKEWVMKLI